MNNTFLMNKVVFLKPVARKGGMVNDPKHIAFFKMEGAYDMYPLKQNDKTGKYINPFSSTEEMEYFSKALGEDLNPNKNDNSFWNTYYVKIVKTPELMSIGKKFDLSDINDALAYKVLLTWKTEVAPTWEQRNKYPSIRYAFVDENYEEKKAVEELDEAFKIGTYYGELKSSDKKMRDFINVYYMNGSKKIFIPDDYNTTSLISELSKIINTDKEGFIKTFEDKNFKIKKFIADCVDRGVIKKIGIGTFIIDGVSTEYSFEELIAQISDWELNKIDNRATDPIYAKLLAVVRSKK